VECAGEVVLVELEAVEVDSWWSKEWMRKAAGAGTSGICKE
jgi:hypothetical protein